MTATVGIGESKTTEAAKSYILDMCAKFNLSYSPWRQELYMSQQPSIREGRLHIADFILKGCSDTFSKGLHIGVLCFNLTLENTFGKLYIML